jgi:hypothetical protein
MGAWLWAIVVAVALLVGGAAAYIRPRWRRSPRAYRAMGALAACYFVAGLSCGRVSSPSLRTEARGDRDNRRCYNPEQPCVRSFSSSSNGESAGQSAEQALSQDYQYH